MRRIFISITPIAAVFLFIVFYFYLESPDKERLNFIHRQLTDNIYEKWQNRLNGMARDEWQIISYDLLYNDLNFFEKYFIDRIFAIDPAEIGFYGPYYSTEKPDKLVTIEPQTIGGKVLGARYTPSHVYSDFERMNEAMLDDIGKRVYVNSGYRSPGRQAYGFIDDLVMERNDYSLKKAARWVAMPGYSEHNSGVNTATDVINAEGISGEEQGQKAEDFASLPEYNWMVKNAGRFNFHLSYPRGNELGVEFEPWHWRWEKK